MGIFGEVLLIAFLSAAVWMDFRSFKISNTLIAAALASGFTLNIFRSGLRGGATALAGCLLLFILLFPLYSLSMLGSGDVKLFMAAGAFTGPGGGIFSLAAAFMIGAVFSITLMIKHRNFFQRLSVLLFYMTQIKSRHDMKPYYDLKNPKRGETLHFSLCIALAVCLYLAVNRGI